MIMARQKMHQVAQQIRRHRLEEPISQLAWLASVGAFARWTQVHYHAPAGGVPWVGMTIRTSTFAFWGQVAREWMALRWWDRPEQHIDRDREDI